MEHKDLLKEEAERLGKVLRKMLSEVLGLKSSGTAANSIEISTRRLQSDLDIGIKELLQKDKSELKSDLLNLKFKEDHIEHLSDYLVATVTNISDTKIKSQYFKTAILLLEIANETSEILNLSRINKQSKLEAYIGSNDNRC